MTSITSEQYLLQKPLLNKLDKIIAPLKQKGLSHFAYNEFFIDGRYHVLCNNLVWVDFFLKNISDLASDLLFDGLHFDKKGHGRIIWALDHKSKMTKKLCEFNVHDGYSIYIKKPSNQKIVSFHFGSIGENCEVYQYYLNAPELFSLFMNYFYAEIGVGDLHKMIPFYSSSVQKKMIYYFDEKSVENIEDFKASIGVHKYMVEFNNIKQSISAKQYECLNLLAQAKTAKEIAQTLELSPRTVESYLLHIRYKFNLQGKEDLLKLFHSIS